MKKIWIASDHAGYELKHKIVLHLNSQSISQGYSVFDLGTGNSQDSVDYPDYADHVCQHIHSLSLVNQNSNQTELQELGILICGSGQGMSIRANKYSHVRAALVWDKPSTELSRQHNDANVLCLGGRLHDHNQALEWVDLFIKTLFLGERHQRRVNKLSQPIHDSNTLK